MKFESFSQFHRLIEWGQYNQDTIFRDGGWRVQKVAIIFFVVWWVLCE